VSLREPVLMLSRLLFLFLFLLPMLSLELIPVPILLPVRRRRFPNHCLTVAASSLAIHSIFAEVVSLISPLQ
jgi:hypothetical protein